MIRNHRRVSIARFAAVLALLSGMLGMAPVRSAHAATLIVTNTNDSGPGSLREAILQPVDGNTITFDPALAGQTITLASDLILSHNVTIDASTLNAPVVLSGGNSSRIMQITINADVTIVGLTFTQGASPDAGGAIFMDGNSQLTLKESTFYQNYAEGRGGAIYKQGNGFVNTEDSIFDQNHAGSSGGAISISGNAPLTILDSTFVDNSASGDGGAIYGAVVVIKKSTMHQNQSNANGGAIAIVGNMNNVISNSTVFENVAGNQGGGIYIMGNVGVNVYSSTFAANTAGSGKEITLLGNAILDLHNTIFVCTTGNENCYFQVSTTIINANHSLLAAGTLVEYGLAELADNGGPTQTMALLPDSPLIDAGDDSVCAGANVNNLDQRGVTRPQGSHCDIGAYEDQSLVRFVKQNATGTNDGSSWSNAHTDLQSALAAVSPDEEIWVAAGTYKPTSTTDRTISFTLKNGVAVYGGFAGTETLRDQRNYETNVTVLSGDIGLENDNSDNSYHVVIGSNTNDSAILDGFTITAGNANDTASSQHYYGGGIYINKGSPRLNEVIFIDNQAGFGGGIYALHTEGGDITVNLSLTNVVFKDNIALGEGGGMATLFRPDLSSASFSLSLTDVVFENNIAVRTGGGLVNNGPELELMDVTFSGNTAIGGGGLSNIPFEPSVLTNVTFHNNFASDGGGGLLIGSGGPIQNTLTNVTFSNNSTDGSGGGIANAALSNLLLTNVTFSGNTAGVNGGGISNGGFFDFEGGTVNLINTTFSNNTATSNGGAIYSERGQINIYNSILYGDTGGEVFVNSGTAAVTYSIVQGGYIGVGNLDEDPLLGPLQDNGGFTQTTALGAGSPAIDAADEANCPDTDQRGVARPQGAGCDIGAYEAQLLNSAPTGISLSPSSVNENQPVGTAVGLLSTIDPDANDSHTYGFCGGANDASFSISGDQLRTAAVFDYETKPSYSVCIRSTDSGGLSTTGAFVIGVNNLIDTQTFGDVSSGYWAQSFIERLYLAGITGGCAASPPMYCPEATVTRAQMAVFLERGIHGSTYNPPAVGSSSGFSDVPINYWAAAWIKQLAADGITGGCGIGLYCPEAPVTRAQMAVFLLRAKYGASYNPPAVGAGTGFGDVPTNHWAAAWIKQLVAESITTGCGNGNYCPDSPVTRAQMAVFLVRTFNLP